MQSLLAVALGGMVGAVLRYLVTLAASAAFNPAFPSGTLIVNVVGSCVMGVLAALLAQAWHPPKEMQLFLLVGVLGGFTTFSSFALDVVSLIERNAWSFVATYLLASVVLSIGGLFAGLAMTRRVLTALS